MWGAANRLRRPSKSNVLPLPCSRPKCQRRSGPAESSSTWRYQTGAVPMCRAAYSLTRTLQSHAHALVNAQAWAIMPLVLARLDVSCAAYSERQRSPRGNPPRLLAYRSAQAASPCPAAHAAPHLSVLRYAITSARSCSFLKPGKAMLVPLMNFFGLVRN